MRSYKHAYSWCPCPQWHSLSFLLFLGLSLFRSLPCYGRCSFRFRFRFGAVLLTLDVNRCFDVFFTLCFDQRWFQILRRSDLSDVSRVPWKDNPSFVFLTSTETQPRSHQPHFCLGSTERHLPRLASLVSIFSSPVSSLASLQVSVCCCFSGSLARARASS